MKAVVLVGGEGTRLRPLTLTAPKQMLPIAEQSMIERVVGYLARHGVKDVVLSLGYRPDAFVDAFPDSTIGEVRLTYAVEPSPLDTAGAIAFAARAAGIDEAFFVVNGDVLTDIDLAGLLALHRSSGAEATISLTPVDNPSAFGVVPTTEDGEVIAFIEKPPRDEAPTNMINAGLYVLEPSVLDRVTPGVRVSIEREIFPALVADGALFALGSDAYWLDTGTPDSYLRAQRDLVAGKRGTAPHPDAVLSGDLGPEVWVTGDVEASGADLKRSLLGAGSIIEAGAVVRDSVIGRGAVIEHDVVVENSVVMPGARVASSARVEDSIVGPGSVVGQRCVVTGVSVIGPEAVVASGTTLDGDRIQAGS